MKHRVTGIDYFVKSAIRYRTHDGKNRKKYLCQLSTSLPNENYFSSDFHHYRWKLVFDTKNSTTEKC